MKVAIDFDNTFFTPNRDVDDGLALLYLLGSGQVELLSVTSSFGNKGIDIVEADTLKLLEVCGLSRELYARGGLEPGAYLSPASRQLAVLAEEEAGELCILATGSLTNLHGAYLYNPHFYQQVKQIVLMGGLTQPLVFAKDTMQELNFSCDPMASFSVLSQMPNLAIMTGNNCLDLLFAEAEYQKLFTRQDSPIVDLIREYSAPWFVDNEVEYGIEGFYNWDSLAAAYLVHPEYYEDTWAEYTVSVEGLATGRLDCPPVDQTSYRTSKPYVKRTLNTPRVARKAALRKHLYDTWQQID